MSVLSEVIDAIKKAGYPALEGDVESVIKQVYKYDEFVAVREESCTHIYENDFKSVPTREYKIMIEVYVTESTSEEAWSRARRIRDTIISTVLGAKYDNVDVLVEEWKRNQIDTESLHASYTIDLAYWRV